MHPNVQNPFHAHGGCVCHGTGGERIISTGCLRHSDKRVAHPQHTVLLQAENTGTVVCAENGVFDCACGAYVDVNRRGPSINSTMVFFGRIGSSMYNESSDSVGCGGCGVNGE